MHLPFLSRGNVSPADAATAYVVWWKCRIEFIDSLPVPRVADDCVQACLGALPLRPISTRFGHSLWSVVDKMHALYKREPRNLPGAGDLRLTRSTRCFDGGTAPFLKFVTEDTVETHDLSAWTLRSLTKRLYDSRSTVGNHMRVQVPS